MADHPAKITEDSEQPARGLTKQSDAGDDRSRMAAQKSIAEVHADRTLSRRAPEISMIGLGQLFFGPVEELLIESLLQTTQRGGEYLKPTIAIATYSGRWWNPIGGNAMWLDRSRSFVTDAIGISQSVNSVMSPEDLVNKLIALSTRKGVKLGDVIVSTHGSPGWIQFGSDSYAVDEPDNVTQFARLRPYLHPKARIIFSGCEIGSRADEAIQNVADVTGVETIAFKWYQLGSLYGLGPYVDKKHKPDDSDELVSRLTKAIENNPSAANVYVKRGDAFYSIWRLTEAIGDYTSAIRINAKNDDIYLKRGNAYTWLRQYQNGIDDYTRAIALNPGMKVYYLQRAFAYEKMGRNDLAKKDRDAAQH